MQPTCSRDTIRMGMACSTSGKKSEIHTNFWLENISRGSLGTSGKIILKRILRLDLSGSGNGVGTGCCADDWPSAQCKRSLLLMLLWLVQCLWGLKRVYIVFNAHKIHTVTVTNIYQLMRCGQIVQASRPHLQLCHNGNHVSKSHLTIFPHLTQGRTSHSQVNRHPMATGLQFMCSASFKASG